MARDPRLSRNVGRTGARRRRLGLRPRPGSPPGADLPGPARPVPGGGALPARPSRRPSVPWPQCAGPDGTYRLARGRGRGGLADGPGAVRPGRARLTRTRQPAHGGRACWPCAAGPARTPGAAEMHDIDSSWSAGRGRRTTSPGSSRRPGPAWPCAGPARATTRASREGNGCCSTAPWTRAASTTAIAASSAA